MKLTMYGIPNCNHMKQARTWLNEHGISFVFFNYKQHHIDTTFRRLDAEDRENIDEEKAIVLMQCFSLLIKRPVLED